MADRTKAARGGRVASDASLLAAAPAAGPPAASNGFELVVETSAWLIAAAPGSPHGLLGRVDFVTHAIAARLVSMVRAGKFEEAAPELRDALAAVDVDIAPGTLQILNGLVDAAWLLVPESFEAYDRLLKWCQTVLYLRPALEIAIAHRVCVIKTESRPRDPAKIIAGWQADATTLEPGEGYQAIRRIQTALEEGESLHKNAPRLARGTAMSEAVEVLRARFRAHVTNHYVEHCAAGDFDAAVRFCDAMLEFTVEYPDAAFRPEQAEQLGIMIQGHESGLREAIEKKWATQNANPHFMHTCIALFRDSATRAQRSSVSEGAARMARFRPEGRVLEVGVYGAAAVALVIELWGDASHGAEARKLLGAAKTGPGKKRSHGIRSAVHALQSLPDQTNYGPLLLEALNAELGETGPWDAEYMAQFPKVAAWRSLAELQGAALKCVGKKACPEAIYEIFSLVDGITFAPTLLDALEMAMFAQQKAPSLARALSEANATELLAWLGPSASEAKKGPKRKGRARSRGAKQAQETTARPATPDHGARSGAQSPDDFLDRAVRLAESRSLSGATKAPASASATGRSAAVCSAVATREGRIVIFEGRWRCRTMLSPTLLKQRIEWGAKWLFAVANWGNPLPTRSLMYHAAAHAMGTTIEEYIARVEQATAPIFEELGNQGWGPGGRWHWVDARGRPEHRYLRARDPMQGVRLAIVDPGEDPNAVDPTTRLRTTARFVTLV